MTAAPKPCLRCGGAVAIHDNDWADPLTWSWRCVSCGLSSGEFLARGEAVADANARPLRWTLRRAVWLAFVIGVPLAGLVFVVLVNLPAPTHEVRP